MLWKKISLSYKDPKAIEDSAATSDAAMGWTQWWCNGGSIVSEASLRGQRGDSSRCLAFRIEALICAICLRINKAEISSGWIVPQDTLHYTRILQKKLYVAALVLGAVACFSFKKGCVMVYFMWSERFSIYVVCNFHGPSPRQKRSLKQIGMLDWRAPKNHWTQLWLLWVSRAFFQRV